MLNLTQHVATPEQISAGVVEPPTVMKRRIQSLLTFNETPIPQVMEEKAEALARCCRMLGATSVMVYQPPYFMSTLERVLKRQGIHVFYAFSKWKTIEEVTPDGFCWKVAVFRHEDFIEA